MVMTQCGRASGQAQRTLFRDEGLEFQGPEMGTPWGEVVLILKTFQGSFGINLRWFREERELGTARRKVQKALMSVWRACALLSLGIAGLQGWCRVTGG